MTMRECRYGGPHFCPNCSNSFYAETAPREDDGLRERIAALPRYTVLEIQGAIQPEHDGEWLRRDAVLALFPPSSSATEDARQP